MGLTAEKVAQQWKVSREDQDAFAVAQRTRRRWPPSPRAVQGDEICPTWCATICPIFGPARCASTERVFDADEGPRPDPLPKAGQAAPGVRRAGRSPPATASQMSDGAGAVLLMSEAAMKRSISSRSRASAASRSPACRRRSWASVRSRPFPALKQAGVNRQTSDWIELNEAFAAQALAVMRTLELDPAR
jgi:acetyl-CoA acyltransferase